MALDFVAGLLLQSLGHVLCGDRAVQFSGLTSFGSEGQHHARNIVGQALQFLVLLSTVDLGLCADAFNLLQSAGSGQHSQSLWNEEVAAVAIGDLFHVTSTAQFVNVLDQHYFHFFKPFLAKLLPLDAAELERRVQRSGANCTRGSPSCQPLQQRVR